MSKHRPDASRSLGRLVLTGGGTAGHVTPHLALLPDLLAAGWECFYIGSAGMEAGLIRPTGIPFYQIAAGKLRRYLSWRNGVDVFRVVFGVVQALVVLGRLRPQVVFSKGGYVSVPVCFAAWVWRIPVVTHESDLTPGLANRLTARVATKVLVSFPQTAALMASAHAEVVGMPLRAELTVGDPAKGRLLCGFEADDERPVLLCMGGSSGALRLNEALVAALSGLLPHFRVIHLTGKGKATRGREPGYAPFEYLSDELADVLALADVVVCRAGATSLFELLALRKPMLLIPLEQGSRGDQVDNARAFAEQGWAQVLRESELTPDRLHAMLRQLVAERHELRAAMARAVPAQRPQERILELLASAARPGAPDGSTLAACE